MRVGDYDLVEHVGTGGMGSVHRAIHAPSGQVVAVKLVNPEHANNAHLLRRFELEHAVASRLVHPHIVRALAFGVEAGRPYLVLEFVEGRSLGQHVRNSGPVVEAEAFRIVTEIASALDYAHADRVVHRDVKPDNILLGTDGQAKLSDLGLVKDLESTGLLTAPRSTLGTITFMAPEQFESAEQVDHRCDVYGLAGTLYFALTGVVPFPGRGNMTILDKKLRNDIVPPSRLVPTLHPEVDDLICRALDVSPDQRPDSCAAFVAELKPGTAATGRERRVARRFPALLKAQVWSLDGSQRLAGDVLDISRTGACIRLAGVVQAGESLRIGVFDDRTMKPSSWLVRVCWVQPEEPAGCRIGGAFDLELTAEELEQLLGSLPPTSASP